MKRNDYPGGEFFPVELEQEIRKHFCYVDHDYRNQRRIFFENAGGSLRLKKAVERFAEVESIGDCPSRIHQVALDLKQIIAQGIKDIRIIFGVSDKGSILTSFTASQVMFEMTRAIAENVPGKNIVTTMLEHPSSYDSAAQAARKFGMELRVATPNQETGGVDPDTISSLIDEDTAFLSIIYASNISGAILNIEAIVKKARSVKPDLFIICDAVQHAPHGLIDAERLQLDAVNFAPYKFFGVRGFSLGWVSDRVSQLDRFGRIIAKPNIDWSMGSTSPAQYAAVSEIVSYVAWIGGHFNPSKDREVLFREGMERIKLQERALMNHILEGTSSVPGLRNIAGVTVYLDDPDLTRRDFILAIEIEGLEYSEAVKEYEKEGVIVFERVATSYFSKRVVEAFQLKGTIRISPLHCHNTSDIDEFLKITKEIAGKYSKKN